MNPLSSSTTLCSPPPTISFRAKTDFVWCSQRFDARHRRKMHTAYNTDLAHHTTHRAKPAPSPHQSTLRRRCHPYSARLPPQCLVELQFWYRLCLDTRIVQQPIMPGFRSQVLHDADIVPRIVICAGAHALDKATLCSLTRVVFVNVNSHSAHIDLALCQPCTLRPGKV